MSAFNDKYLHIKLRNLYPYSDGTYQIPFEDWSRNNIRDVINNYLVNYYNYRIIDSRFEDLYIKDVEMNMVVDVVGYGEKCSEVVFQLMKSKK